MIVTKQREKCGKTLENVVHWKKYCDNCKKEVRILRNRKEQAKANGEPDPEYLDNCKSSMKNVNAVLRKAKEHNMTYGQYVAIYGRS